MADFARDLAGFLDALDIPSAVIVGHSMGSFVGQRFAMDHPDRTLGLVLMGSGAQMSENPVVREIRDGVLKQSDPVDPGFVREFQAGTLARSVAPSLFHAVVAESLKVPVRVWHETFAGFLDLDHRADLSRITAPTMIVWGNCDTVFVESDQAALRDCIAGARMVIYRGGGHGFHWEDAAAFAADLVVFCGTVRR
jgi:pimeloyl-ACP methyl ester carboxylesterase